MDSKGVNYTGRLRARRLGDIFSLAKLVKDSLSHDRAGGVARADKQNAHWHGWEYMKNCGAVKKWRPCVFGPFLS